MERKSRTKEAISRRRGQRSSLQNASQDAAPIDSSRAANLNGTHQRNYTPLPTVNNMIINNNYIKIDYKRKNRKRKGPRVFSSSQYNRFDNSSDDSSTSSQKDRPAKSQIEKGFIPNILKGIPGFSQQGAGETNTNITINNIQIHGVSREKEGQKTILGKRSGGEAGLAGGDYKIKKKGRRGRAKEGKEGSPEAREEGEKSGSERGESGRKKRKRREREKKRRKDKAKTKRKVKDKKKKTTKRRRARDEGKTRSSKRNTSKPDTEDKKTKKAKPLEQTEQPQHDQTKLENLGNPAQTSGKRKDSNNLIMEALHNESEHSDNEIKEEKTSKKKNKTVSQKGPVKRSRVITRRRAKEISSQEHLENEKAAGSENGLDVSGLGEKAEGTERERIIREKKEEDDKKKEKEQAQAQAVKIEEEPKVNQQEVSTTIIYERFIRISNWPDLERIFGKFNPKTRVEIQPKKQTHSKKSKVVLNTAHKVLKKHLDKVKSKLISRFNDRLQVKIEDTKEPNIEVEEGLTIKSKSNKMGELVLIFTPVIQDLKDLNQPQTQTTETTEKSNLAKTRSARMNSKLNLILQIDQQDKLEKIEISFLSLIVKIFEKLGKSAERGMFVYFSDYLKALKRGMRRVSVKFPKLTRGDIMQILSANLEIVRDKYREQKLSEIKKLSDHLIQFKINSSTYPRVHLQNRVYHEVVRYSVNKSVLRSLENCREVDVARKKFAIKRLMRSEIKPKCAGPECDCCRQPLEAFCEFKPNQSNWISQCEDKKGKIECDDSCGCGPNCHNSFLRRGEMQILGKDVSLRQCWGVDFYSRKNLFHLLPRHLTVPQKGLIIDNALRELNFQGSNGWNVTLALVTTYKALTTRFNEIKTGLNSKKVNLNITPPEASKRVGGDLHEFLYSPRNDWAIHIKQIEVLTHATEVLVKQMRIKQLRECVKSFSKGLGVVCTNQNGISRNSLIVKYFGEVYPPWYWYLKQDAIKSFLTQLKKGKFRKLAEYQNDYNMEFYNIFLEKHRSEPKGTELLIVDPIMKGNYASRLSHACVPNCVTLPVVSSGQYSIGLYAQKKVRHGDELTFDYCSFTESEKEYQNSVCLCGSSHCRGYYLSCNRKHFHVFVAAKSVLLDNSDKCFLVWNMILLKSCVSSFDKFKEERLKRFSIGENIFKNSPEWLKTWAFFVVEQILKERAALYDFYFQKTREEVLQTVLTDLRPLERNWRYEIENLFEQRLQNLIISLDKALNFLDRQKVDLDTFDPLQLNSLRQSYKTAKSLLSTLVEYSPLKDRQLEGKVRSFLETDTLPEADEKNIPAKIAEPKLRALVRAKYLIFLLSEYFKRHWRSHEYHPALGDILYFHSMTKMTFSMNSFSGFEIEIHVRDCDLTNPLKLLTRTTLSEIEQQSRTNQIIYTMKKKIAASYLWGQLVFWNKQTIEKPEASLSAGRRGTLTYPEIAQSFLNPGRKFWDKFPWGSRQNWLDSIRDKPGDYWPIGDGWSYENKEKVYGTFLSDDFFLGTNNRFRIIENIDSSIPFKFGVFINIWKNYYD